MSHQQELILIENRIEFNGYEHTVSIVHVGSMIVIGQHCEYGRQQVVIPIEMAEAIAADLTRRAKEKR